MARQRQSGPAGTGRGKKVELHGKPATAQPHSTGHQARADRRHTALLGLLASLQDPLVAALGLSEAEAVQHPIALAACRSAAVILVLEKPDLARDAERLARETSRLLRVVMEVAKHGSGA